MKRTGLGLTAIRRHIIEDELARQNSPCIRLHTECPRGYVAWHEWAEEMSETLVQEQCPGCGLWAIWTLK